MIALIANSISIIVPIVFFTWLGYRFYQYHFIVKPQLKIRREEIKNWRAYLDSLTSEKMASMSDEEKEAEVYRLLDIKKEEK